MSRKTTNPTRSSQRRQTTIGGLILTVLIVLVTRWLNSGGNAILPTAIATATAQPAIVQLANTPVKTPTEQKQQATSNQTYSAATQVTKPTATPVSKKQAKATATPQATATIRPTVKAIAKATLTATRRPTATSTPANPTRPGPRGMATLRESELPKEARTTLRLIDEGGPFPYNQDGIVFQNREGILPRQARGYYHEYTVETPGSRDRGPRRIVTGDDGEFYYTEDHYDSFYWVERD
jgi:ribonuclease T1